MGYVRMIKAGGLHFVSNSIRFVPDLDDIPNFEQLTIEEVQSQTEQLQNDTIAREAAKTLDEVVANLVKNFSDNTEYFQVRAFSPFLPPVVVVWEHSKRKNYILNIDYFSSWSTFLASNCMRINTLT